MKAALFDAPKRQRWTGSRALVLLPSDACPSCGGTLQTMSVGQPALFRHGGYGATLASTVRWCHCGWRLEAVRQETRPA